MHNVSYEKPDITRDLRGRFHWAIQQVLGPLGGGKGGLGIDGKVEQCSTQKDASGPCEGFDSAEAAMKDGERRRQELRAGLDTEPANLTG